MRLLNHYSYYSSRNLWQLMLAAVVYNTSGRDRTRTGAQYLLQNKQKKTPMESFKSKSNFQLR